MVAARCIDTGEDERGRFRLVTSTEADGRTRTRKRYTGHGHRGAPNLVEADGGELQVAIREMIAGRAALLAAYEMPDGFARREARKAALGKLALASRIVDDVVARRGGTPGDVAVDRDQHEDRSATARNR